MEKEEYKEKFIEYIVNSCKAYNHGLYSDKDEAWFNTLAEKEYEAQEEAADDDIEYENPELDAEECMSYWD